MATVEQAGQPAIVRVLPGCRAQYGYSDHRGDPQHRVYKEGEEFSLMKPEHFSFRTMEPVNAAAEEAKAAREELEREREQLKLASAQSTDALQAKVNNLEKQLAALMDALQPKQAKK